MYWIREACVFYSASRNRCNTKHVVGERGQCAACAPRLACRSARCCPPLPSYPIAAEVEAPPAWPCCEHQTSCMRCVCVCVCVSMPACACVCLYVCACVRACVCDSCTSACVNACVHACLGVYMRENACVTNELLRAHSQSGQSALQGASPTFPYPESRDCNHLPLGSDLPQQVFSETGELHAEIAAGRVPEQATQCITKKLVLAHGLNRHHSTKQLLLA